MKKALVLCGGGTKGIYEAGAIEALHQLGKDDWNLITGTSVGALNAAMLVQHDDALMSEMYEHLEAKQIVNGFVPNDMSVGTLIKEREEFVPSLIYYIKEKGVDISPFIGMVDRYYNPVKFFTSDIDFGCITATKDGHKPKYVTKEMMRENGKDWLIASASAYPAFPVRVIDGVEYVDGGYFDNLPIDYAFRMGADEVIAIDLHPVPIHPHLVNRKFITYIRPHEELFNFLDFDKEKMLRGKLLGFLDTMKIYGVYTGRKYTFYPFTIPEEFADWYRHSITLDTEIYQASRLSQRLHSENYIGDELKKRLYLDSLTYEDYFFGMVDAMMDLEEYESASVYDFDTCAKEMIADFLDAMQEDYPYKPEFKDMPSYIRTLDQKAIIKKILHGYFYPEHTFFNDNVVYTVYPKQKAMADFVAFTLKHYA